MPDVIPARVLPDADHECPARFGEFSCQNFTGHRGVHRADVESDWIDTESTPKRVRIKRGWLEWSE